MMTATAAPPPPTHCARAGKTTTGTHSLGRHYIDQPSPSDTIDLSLCASDGSLSSYTTATGPELFMTDAHAVSGRLWTTTAATTGRRPSRRNCPAH